MDVESIKKYIDKWKWLRNVPGYVYHRRYLVFTNKGRVVVEGNTFETPWDPISCDHWFSEKTNPTKWKMQWNFYVYEDEPFVEKKHQFKFLIKFEKHEHDSKVWTETRERLLVCVLKKTLINALTETNDGNHDNGDEIET